MVFPIALPWLAGLRAFVVGGTRIGMVIALAGVAGSAWAAEPRLDVPLSAYVPAAATFIARVSAIRSWAKKTAGEPEDRRVTSKARDMVSRRSSAPLWASRSEPWADTGEYTVFFAVGRVEDYQSSSAALNEAERRAKAAVAKRAGGMTPYALDWYVNDDGVAWALVGVVEPPKKEEPNAERPTDAETPVP